MVGIAAFAIIHGVKTFRPNFPSGLIAMIATTVAVYTLNLEEVGVVIVGVTPAGLPSLFVPPFNIDVISSLIGPAVVIAMVSFAETYSVGKAISSETKQHVDVNQEFVGQGIANLVGSFFQCYPVSGSFSRSAINFSAGAKTSVSSVVSSVAVIITLLFLTPLLTFIPRAALAALVISAVLILFHPKEVFSLWKRNRDDGVVAGAVFILALLTKPDYALLIGILISMVFFLWKTMHPRIVRVTKDPEFNMFVDADANQKPGCPQILQLRSENALFFANAEYTVEHIIERIDAQGTLLKFLLLDFQTVPFVDITGVDELRVLLEALEERGMKASFETVHLPVKKVFESSGFLSELDPELFIGNRGEAIRILFQRLDYDYCKNVCQYKLFHECPTVK
jgi:SulP family sulfate permease